MAKKAKSKSTGKAKKSAPKKKTAPAKKSGAVKSKGAAKPKSTARSGGKPAAKAKGKPAAKPAVKPAAKSVAKPVSAKSVAKPVQSSVHVAMSRPVAHIAKRSNVVEDNRTRYSDAELKEFKVLIHKKLEEATRDYELLKNTLSHKDDHGTDDTSPTFKLLEDGSDVLSKEETAHLAARQEKYIQNLKNALIRIENKTYGICRVTGKLIPKERLRSVPHATLSIDAKLGQNR